MKIFDVKKSSSSFLFILFSMTGAYAADPVDEVTADVVSVSEAGPSTGATDYLPGALIDRKTGDRIRVKCPDSACSKATYALFDGDGNEIAQSELEATRSTEADLDRNDRGDTPFEFTIVDLGILGADPNRVDQAVAAILLPAALITDTVMLPYVGASTIDLAIFKSKLKKFYRKEVKITDRRFETVRKLLFR
jgi:uncharacterized protein YceK